MDFSFPSIPSPLSSMDLGVSVPDVLLSCHSSSLNGKSCPRSVICSIPHAKCVVPEPLVASKEIDSLSSEESKILYALRSRDILAKAHMGLGACIDKVRGRGGNVSGRNRGIRSNIDHAKEKALFNCVIGTQLTI